MTTIIFYSYYLTGTIRTYITYNRNCKKISTKKFMLFYTTSRGGTQERKFNFVKIFFRSYINGGTRERKFSFVKKFSLSPGIEPRTFIPRVPQLYHSSTIAQFNIEICCIYSMTGQVKFPSHNVTLKYSIFQIYDYNHISSPCCIISSPVT